MRLWISGTICDVDSLIHFDWLIRPEGIACLVILGAVVGVQTAYFGLGGGWIVTPFLHLAGLPATWAVGTGMAYLAATSLYSVLRHRGRSAYDLRLGLAYGVIMALGVEAARRGMLHVEHMGAADNVFRILYIAMLSGVGLWMFRAAQHETAVAKPSTAAATDSPPGPACGCHLRFPRSGIRIHAARLAAEGAGIGLFSGMLGIGGGFALVPILSQGHGLPMLSAVTTSLVAVCCTGLAGTAGYAWAGRVDGLVVLALFAGSIIGVPLGVRAAQRSDSSSVKRLYGYVLWLGAISVSLGATGHPVIGASLAAGGASLVSAWILIRGRPRRSGA